MKSATFEELQFTACADAVRLAHFDEAVQAFCLPPCSPKLNFIEIVWKHAKCHWRKTSSAGRRNIDDQIGELLGFYGTKFQINFAE
jgi:transposase